MQKMTYANPNASGKQFYNPNQQKKVNSIDGIEYQQQ